MTTWATAAPATTARHVPSGSGGTRARVGVDGKHLTAGGQPFRLRGATYGSFVHRIDGEPFPQRTQIKIDLSTMAACGMNTVRTYGLPPVELLDLAAELDVRVLVGLDYADWRYESSTGRRVHRRVLDNGRRALDAALERCGGRPEVLAISVGNEVPGDLVRLHGIGGVEDVLGTLAAEVHTHDPSMLVTYSSFPTTEYLRIDALDFLSFNVFLEDPDKLRRYLRHLQVVAGDRPLVITELGLASGIHGEEAQAASLEWQLRLVDEAGCAGATVFAWTDDWGVDGKPVEGWGFGLTTVDRQPKPALAVAQEWARRSLGDLRDPWPRMSVVVCAYNEERTLDECLSSLQACDYPDLEVIVCDDGSTDRTLEIARRYPFRILELPHGGLSAARNAGIAAASGDIVAFLDADAAAHPEWPYHLALSLEDDNVAGTGGPNLPVVGAGLVERAVALSPGGPVEVLVGDDRAEHVPGCNMAYWRNELVAVGGFNPEYTSAGDDVDVCWKLLDRGSEIAFAPAAQVRHHRRATVRSYLRQQRGYGRAERMLTGPHPHRFNRLGQARWRGFIYGGARLVPSLLRPVVYHGHQGHAPFQSVAHHRAEHVHGWASALLPLLVPVALAGLVLAPVAPAALWAPAAVLAVLAGYGVSVAASLRLPKGEPQPEAVRALVAWFHVAQPLVRAWGRLRGRPVQESIEQPTPVWYGDRAGWLRSLEEALSARRCSVRVAGPTRSFDLQASVGPLVAARVTTAVTWGWTPHHRVQLRPRPHSLLLLAAMLMTVTAGWTLFIAVLGAGALAAIAEATWLRRVVSRTIRETTSAVTADLP